MHHSKQERTPNYSSTIPIVFSSPLHVCGNIGNEGGIGGGVANCNLGNEWQSCLIETSSSAAVSLVSLTTYGTYMGSRDVYHQLQFSFASRVCGWCLAFVHFIIQLVPVQFLREEGVFFRFLEILCSQLSWPTSSPRFPSIEMHAGVWNWIGSRVFCHWRQFSGSH